MMINALKKKQELSKKSFFVMLSIATLATACDLPSKSHAVASAGEHPPV
jgi:hypothetical protein